jgi:hypothetical protein
MLNIVWDGSAVSKGRFADGKNEKEDEEDQETKKKKKKKMKKKKKKLEYIDRWILDKILASGCKNLSFYFRKRLSLIKAKHFKSRPVNLPALVLSNFFRDCKSVEALIKDISRHFSSLLCSHSRFEYRDVG